MLLTCPKDNPKLAFVTVKLLCTLTLPIKLAFEELKPDEDPNKDVLAKMEVTRYLQAAKRSFLREDVIYALIDLLSDALTKDRFDRTENDNNLMEILFTLFRNLLHIPDPMQEPLQDALIKMLQNACFLDMVVSCISTNNDTYASLNELGIEAGQWNYFLLEIVYLLFRDVTATSLVNAQDEVDRGLDKNRVRDNLSREIVDSFKQERREQLIRQGGNIGRARHSRFGGSFVLQQFDGSKQFFNRPIASLNQFNVDEKKVDKKRASIGSSALVSEASATDALKALTDASLDVVEDGSIDGFASGKLADGQLRISAETRVVLLQFGQAFLESCFHPMLVAVGKDLERGDVTPFYQEHQAMYLWTIRFFLCLHREASQLAYKRLVKRYAVERKAYEAASKLPTVLETRMAEPEAPPKFLLDMTAVGVVVTTTMMNRLIRELHTNLDEFENDRKERSAVNDMATAADGTLAGGKKRGNNAALWTRRLQLTLLALQEFLQYVQVMSTSPDDLQRGVARSLHSNLFYEEETLDTLVKVLKEYDFRRQSKDYLRVVIETMHILLRQLEHYSKEHSSMVVLSKRKTRRRKKTMSTMDTTLTPKKGRQDHNSAEASEDETEEASAQHGEQSEETPKPPASATAEQAGSNAAQASTTPVKKPVRARRVIDDDDDDDDGDDNDEPDGAAASSTMASRAPEQLPETTAPMETTEQQSADAAAVVGFAFDAAPQEDEESLEQGQPQTTSTPPGENHEDVAARQPQADQAGQQTSKLSKGKRSRVVEDEDEEDKDEDEEEANAENRPSKLVDEEGLEEELEDDDRDEAGIRHVEREFSFSKFESRFARPDVVTHLCRLMRDFKSNTPFTNHCIVKLCHRIAVHCDQVELFFHVSALTIFNTVLQDPDMQSSRGKANSSSSSSSKKDDSKSQPKLREDIQQIKGFATFIAGKFFEALGDHPFLCLEALFWHSIRMPVHKNEAFTVRGRHIDRSEYHEEHAVDIVDEDAAMDTSWSLTDELAQLRERERQAAELARARAAELRAPVRNPTSTSSTNKASATVTPASKSSAAATTPGKSKAATPETSRKASASTTKQQQQSKSKRAAGSDSDSDENEESGDDDDEDDDDDDDDMAAKQKKRRQQSRRDRIQQRSQRRERQRAMQPDDDDDDDNDRRPAATALEVIEHRISAAPGRRRALVMSDDEENSDGEAPTPVATLAARASNPATPARRRRRALSDDDEDDENESDNRHQQREEESPTKRQRLAGDPDESEEAAQPSNSFRLSAASLEADDTAWNDNSRRIFPTESLSNPTTDSAFAAPETYADVDQTPSFAAEPAAVSEPQTYVDNGQTPAFAY
ncbi:hypothetical protein CAOG_000958 [Capsaspora owczarzaki ATCC 30864]|uniref:Timeless N-terminal domain-containing protein n=2 Tax=Capsaspora owczarzaki (strain ATCC 30864) TaxID=595528 RepID=A0A0D2U2U3_CAPO3|nr:hypothetical protein CAOG_000958 [Capsaspora owczarzaki ATCC 30864]